MTSESENTLNANLLIIHAKFERIAKAIELYWGEPECPPYINALLSDGRNNRKGFPYDVLTAIVTLQGLHDQLFPEHIIEDPDEWTSSQFGIL